VQAELRVPGDKSISHRAVLLGGLAAGASTIRGFLPSGDCLHTLGAMRALGVCCEVLDEVPGSGPVELRLHGCECGLRAPAAPIECGNSGTGMRLLAGILAGQRFDSELHGDASLSSRPMGRVIDPLERMGARIESLGARPGCAPLRIHGAPLRGIRYRLPVASAQVKSAVLLAGLFAGDETAVLQPAPTRDHTERMLAAFGVPVRHDDGGWIVVAPGRLPQGREFVVPGDFSSAAFWLVAAAVRPGNRIVVREVGLNPTRTALLDVLRRMGAGVTEVLESGGVGEPVGRIEVTGAELGDCEVLPGEVPNLIDELPVLAVAGALGMGRFTVRNARELRVKETDRIAAMATNLRAMGAEVEEFEDGFEVRGGRPLRGATVASFGDHRVAMACAVAGLFASGGMVIRDTGCIATSYPGFAGHLQVMAEGGGGPDQFDAAAGTV
jgi:3-phosphoshikimate 1-carboxyvinyltransferase